LIRAAPVSGHTTVAKRCWNGSVEEEREMQMQMERKLNVTTRQVLNDLAFTAVAALGTGAAVGGIAFIVVRLFA
jgi:hypothetical protein